MPQTKTKTKRRRADEEDDELPVVEALPLEAPVKERKPETMHEREHLGLEVASDLTLGGLATFLSVTTRGVNLVAGNLALTAFIPTRIMAVEDGGRLELKTDDVRLLSDTDGVVAFLIGEEDGRDRYYVPIAEFLSRAEQRDARQVAEFDKTWLRPFAGHAGVARAFGRLLK